MPNARLRARRAFVQIFAGPVPVPQQVGSGPGMLHEIRCAPGATITKSYSVNVWDAIADQQTHAYPDTSALLFPFFHVPSIRCARLELPFRSGLVVTVQCGGFPGGAICLVYSMDP